MSLPSPDLTALDVPVGSGHALVPDKEMASLKKLAEQCQQQRETIQALLGDNVQLRRYICQNDTNAEAEEPMTVGDALHHEMLMMLQALDNGLGEGLDLHDKYLKQLPVSEWVLIRAWRAAAAFLEDEIKALAALSTKGASQTTIQLCRMLLERDKLSATKYKDKTLDREDLKPSDWEMHLLEEQLDASAYTLRSYQKRKKLEAKVSAFLGAYEQFRQKESIPSLAFSDKVEACESAIAELRREFETE